MAEPLDVNTPVDKETLEILNRLEVSRTELGVRLLTLEQERIRILATAHEVDSQRSKAFERVLTERGLPGTAQIEIDSSTGRINLLNPPMPSPADADVETKPEK